MQKSIEQTKTQFYHFNNKESPFELKCGEHLSSFTLAYEVYGELSEKKDNAVLLFHALSASQHAAGINENVDDLTVEWDKECQIGWWDEFIGPGKALTGMIKRTIKDKEANCFSINTITDIKNLNDKFKK